jgi:hypothetical protein
MRLKVHLIIPLNFWSIPRVGVSFHDDLQSMQQRGTARSVSLIGYSAASCRKRRTLKPCLAAADNRAELPAWGMGLAVLDERTWQGTWSEPKLWYGCTGYAHWLGSQMGRLSTADWPDTAPGVDVREGLELRFGSRNKAMHRSDLRKWL